MDRNLVIEGAMRNLFTTKFTKSELTNPIHQISDVRAKMHQIDFGWGSETSLGGSNGTYRGPTDDLNYLSDRGGQFSCLKPF